jgi:prephenate dehydrogenase
MLFDQITIVGVGLIGGSVGLAAKARGVAGRVVGHGRDPAKLWQAVRFGAIDAGAADLADAVRSAGLVVVCTPVDLIADTILAAAPHCRPGAIFTDGGSTKGNLVAAVEGKLPAGVEYVAAHPLAGSEKTGAENGRADLFVDRVTVLTPTDRTAPAAVEKVAAFWRGLGCRLVTMSPEAHDAALAVTSHLPHVAAAAVAGITDPELLALTAGGFRDVTRIAAGDPRMWEAIFRANRPHVLDALSRFAARLDEFRRLVEADDGPGLTRWLTEAKRVRDALGS